MWDLKSKKTGGMVLMASMSVSKTEDPGSSPGAPAITLHGIFFLTNKSRKFKVNNDIRMEVYND